MSLKTMVGMEGGSDVATRRRRPRQRTPQSMRDRQRHASSCGLRGRPDESPVRYALPRRPGRDAAASESTRGDRRGRSGVSHAGHCSSKCGSGGAKPDWQRPSPARGEGRANPGSRIHGPRPLRERVARELRVRGEGLFPGLTPWATQMPPATAGCLSGEPRDRGWWEISEPVAGRAPESLCRRARPAGPGR